MLPISISPFSVTQLRSRYSSNTMSRNEAARIKSPPLMHLLPSREKRWIQLLPLLPQRIEHKAKGIVEQEGERRAYLWLHITHAKLLSFCLCNVNKRIKDTPSGGKLSETTTTEQQHFKNQQNDGAISFRDSILPLRKATLHSVSLALLSTMRRVERKWIKA